MLVRPTEKVSRTSATSGKNESRALAFYSKKLSMVEQNYDIGNRELLAIKLVIEVWRHWFTHHPSEIITDYRNLEYIRKAKRLNL